MTVTQIKLLKQTVMKEYRLVSKKPNRKVNKPMTGHFAKNDLTYEASG